MARANRTQEPVDFAVRGEPTPAWERGGEVVPDGETARGPGGAVGSQAGAWPLARRLVPTLYGVADGLVPAAPGRRGGGDVDVAPGVARRLLHRGPAAVRRTHLVLAWLEWVPRLWTAGLRPFSRLARERRVDLLARLRHSPVPPLRRALAELEALVEEVLEAEGVPPRRDPEPRSPHASSHSSEGA